MPTFKRLISYSPYLLVLLLVFPVLAEAQELISIKKMLWSFVNNVFGFLLGASGLLLDYAVNNFVIGFGDTWGIGGAGVGGAIDLSWVVVRDIFNITFIFGLVWIGFQMILNGGDSNAKRTLIYLILAALLVNFSLFITKFIVDFTNILATQIAGAFVQNPATGTADISTSFMQLFGVNNIFAWQTNTAGIDPSEESYMYIFGTAIVFLIGAFCFAAGGIMLIIRFAALCIYMVFSPLMFIGWVFPGLQKVSRDYWSGFLGRAFYAPAYLMLIYLAAYVMGTYNENAPQFRDAFSGGSPDTIATTIGPFMLTCVFLIASVVVAGKMSADGASTAISVGRNIRGRSQRLVRNSSIGLGRATASGIAGGGARAINSSSDRLRRSYDLKDAQLQASGKRRLPDWADSTLRGALDKGTKVSIAGSLTKDQYDERAAQRQKRANTTLDEKQRKDDYGNNLMAAKHGFDADTRAKASGEIAKAIGKMSTDELTQIDLEQLQNSVTASKLSDTQIKALADTGKYTNADIKAIKDARTEGIFSGVVENLEGFSGNAKELNESLEELNRTVVRWSTETLESMGEKKLSDQRIATNLSQRQIDTLRDSGKITTADYQKITAARDAGFANIASTGSVVDTTSMPSSEAALHATEQRKKLFSQSAQEAGKLPASVFADPNMTEFITPNALQQRVRNGLNPDEMQKIEAELRRYITLQTPTSNKARNAWEKWATSTTEGANFNLVIQTP